MNYKFLLILLLVLANQLKSGSDWLWSHPEPPSNPLFAVHVFDSLNILAMGEAGIMLRSSDFGQTWDVTYSEHITKNIYGCYFFDRQKGLIVGENGLIYRR